VEAAGGEAAVAREGVAQVSHAHQHDRATSGEPELAGDLLDQQLHVVANAAGAVGAELRQVLANLRAGHARCDGEAVGGDGADARIGQLGKDPEVER